MQTVESLGLSEADEKSWQPARQGRGVLELWAGAASGGWFSSMVLIWVGIVEGGCLERYYTYTWCLFVLGRWEMCLLVGFDAEWLECLDIIVLGAV